MNRGFNEESKHKENEKSSKACTKATVKEFANLLWYTARIFA